MGDTELWVVNGEGWELPVLADPYGMEEKQTHWRLRPPLDCGITGPMLRALDKRTDSIRVPAESNHVIVTYEGLSTIARKAPGITPSFYLQWPGEEKVAGQVEEERVNPTPDPTDAGKDFCAYLFRLTGVVDYPTLRLVWRAICQYGPKWMMEEKKPINLGFCKIIPSPYRINWRGLLTAKFPGFWRKEVFFSPAFTKESTNTMLATYSTKHNVLLYGLEVVPGESWKHCSTLHEIRRLAAMGRVGYAEYWRRSVIKLYPHLLEAFREWARAVRLPCGGLGDGIVFGGRPIIPWVPQGRVKPSAPADPAVGCVVIDPERPKLKGPEATIPLSKKERHVLELSDLQPEPRHVRLLGNGGPERDVEESSDERDGTDGLRLLDAGEGEEPGSDLLVEGEGI